MDILKIERKDLFQQVLQPIKGDELRNIFPFYSKFLSPQFIAEGPEEALISIEHFFGEKPNLTGNNIEGINEIRLALLEYCGEKAKLKGFSIIAPHTHWDENDPIIYQFVSGANNYKIGHHKLIDNGNYTPVSFIMTNDGPLPFEWADETININAKELEELSLVLKKVVAKLCSFQYPLGIGFDFRFKKSLYETNIASVEVSDLEAGEQDFSLIFRSNAFSNSRINKAVEQVAWHPFHSNYFQFTEEDYNYINHIKNAIDDQENSSDKANLIENLENLLKNNKW